MNQPLAGRCRGDPQEGDGLVGAEAVPGDQGEQLPVVGGQAGEGVANGDCLIGRWGRFAEAMLEVGSEAVGKGVAAGLADRLRAHLEHRLREAAPPADETVAIRDALTRLPADDRELLTLVAWDGLRTDEAAALLGITSAAARQRLVRARRRLRAELDEATGPTSGDRGPATFTPTDTWPRAPAKR